MTFIEYDPGEDVRFAAACDGDWWTTQLLKSLSPHIRECHIVTDKELQLRGTDQQLILKNGKAVNVEMKYDRNSPVNFALEYRVRHELGVFTKPDQLTHLFTYIFWHEDWRLRSYFVFSWTALKKWWDRNEAKFIAAGDRDTRNEGRPFRCYYIRVSDLIVQVPPMLASGDRHVFERQLYARQKIAQRHAEQQKGQR